MYENEPKKSHKSKNKHKYKKKKHSHKKKKSRSSSSGSDDSGEMEWVEAPITKINKPSQEIAKTTESAKNENKREDWMNEESFVATLSKDDMRSCSSRQKKIEAANMKRKQEEAIQKDRELNPHWKNNGTGLPEEQRPSENLTLPSTSVGDGGYSYLKKAYLRILEQSQQEGRSMDEIAVERWGSLDKLTTMIKEAEERMRHNSKTKHQSDKKHSDYRKESKSSHYKRPSDSRRSPSYSPERSFKYQKPERNKRDKRLGQYSSKDKKRSEKNTSYTLDSDDESDSSHKKHKEKRHFPEQRSENTDKNRENVPAWKKVKPAEKELSDQEKSENIFVWDKKSSYQGKTSKFDESSSKQPNWKKDQRCKQKQNYSESEYSDDEKQKKSRSPKMEDNTQKSRDSFKCDNSFTVTSEDDLNKLAARCTKAEIMGDAALASVLRKQLEEARESLKTGGNVQMSKQTKDRVMLTKIDSSGQERPIHYSHDIKESQSKQRKKQSQKFFDDGSRYSLKQMFEREKLTTADDNLEMFMEVAGKCKDADDENETSGISKKATNKMAHHLQEEKDVARAMQQHHKRNAILEKCNYCLDQPSMKGHLIVNIFELVLLCIPDFQSIVEGHCLIVPKRHVSSFLALDEEEWKEVEDLKLNLRSLFQKQNKNIIILETSKSFKYYPHAFLEIIPVPEEISDMAPIYFKKAILESESEWANNIKLIDLSKKGLRHSVPKNLPYFCVQFDPKLHAGYAHVIEDERNFEKNFGKEVIGGMLDIDYNYLFKNRKEDPTKKSKETVEFVKMWKAFNGDDDS